MTVVCVYSRVIGFRRTLQMFFLYTTIVFPSASAVEFPQQHLRVWWWLCSRSILVMGLAVIKCSTERGPTAELICFASTFMQPSPPKRILKQNPLCAEKSAAKFESSGSNRQLCGTAKLYFVIDAAFRRLCPTPGRTGGWDVAGVSCSISDFVVFLNGDCWYQSFSNTL